MNSHVHPTIAAVLDTYTSGGTRNAQWALDAEWRETREALRRLVLRAELVLEPLESMPRPLFASEQKAQQRAASDFAKLISDGLTEALESLLAPIRERAIEARVDLSHYTVDRSDFDAAVAKIMGRA